jgi:hypothetical protein
MERNKWKEINGKNINHDAGRYRVRSNCKKNTSKAAMRHKPELARSNSFAASMIALMSPPSWKFCEGERDSHVSLQTPNVFPPSPKKISH